jgi:hypothetical protein
VLVLAFVAAVVAMVGLGAAGVNFAFYPTSVLVIPGLAWAALMAARANWRELATGLALVVIGIVGAHPWPGQAPNNLTPTWCLGAVTPAVKRGWR